MEPVIADRLGRIKRKLRLSLTDRCNFRCAYCMPETPAWAQRSQILTRPEMMQLTALFVERLGIRQLRLTGGEPLLRPDLEDCIADFNQLREAGLERISLTTNGTMLKQRAAALKHAGLDDINISLDALEPDRFHALSGGRGSVHDVLQGIDEVMAIGLPAKINTVVLRDYNEDQILPLVQWAITQRVSLRFIEFMPLDNHGAWSSNRVVTEAEILDRLRMHYRVEPLPHGNDPARYYQLDEHFSVGMISTISNPFCASCDRLRLTATGQLYACLFSSQERDLRTAMRMGMDDDALESIIRGHVWKKDTGYAATGYVERPISMNALGG